MSRRTVTRFALTGLLAAALAGPAAAQTPNPWRAPTAAVAPMPRPAPGLAFGLPPFVRIEFDLTPTNPVAAPPARARGVVEVEFRVTPDDFEVFTVPVAPAVRRGVPPPPCCAFDCLQPTPAYAAKPVVPPAPPQWPTARADEKFHAAERRPPILPGAPGPVAAPGGSPDATKQMMMEVFGEMLGKPGCAPANLPPAACPVQPAGWSVSNPAVIPPPPPLPAPRVGPVGTWVREVGPVVYVLKITPDHLTLTATAAVEVGDGKVLTEGLVLTADYHPTPNGANLLGLITGVDAILDGPTLEGADVREWGNELTRLQKSLTDKPFALGVRVYGDVLVIGNVRMPEAEGRATFPLASLGGRYTALGDSKPLPKPKPVMPTVVTYDSLPAVTAAPVVTSPPVSAPAAIPAAAESAPAPRAADAAGQAEPANPGKKVRKKAKSSGTPNARWQLLPHQSEDLRQIQSEWQRFWFNEQPGHLTIERIHGGIR